MTTTARRSKRGLKQATSWLLVAWIVLGWFLFLRPAFMGGSASYVMVSGISMEPRMHTGDFVIATRSSSYEIGDVIAYKVPEGEPGAGGMVIHRVIGGNGTDGYITQGDNREEPDFWYPTDGDVLGEMRFMIPNAGAAISILRTPIGIAAVAAIMVFVIVAFDKSSGTSLERGRQASSN